MKVTKSYEITDAKISFVSLVDKAANKRQFLITKAEAGAASFESVGRIIKIDADRHYITGVVYEPMVADSHDNYMTEDEILKAAYWFAKNGDKVDLQHDFEELESATVVETWVTKSDETIAGEVIQKGTWLMTVEIADPSIWEKVEKKEITGFSMGGVGKYSDQDVDLKGVEKGGQDMGDKNASTNQDVQKEQKGLLQKFAGLLGLDVVEKGAMMDNYNARIKSTRFWTAFSTLQDMLYRYNWNTDRYEYEQDERTIQEALAEFSEIITEVLAEPNIMKTLAADKEVIKAGKKMSTANKTKLDEIAQALSDFTSQFAEEEEDPVEKNAKEDTDMKPEDIQKMIQDEIKKAMEAAAKPAAPVEKAEGAKPAEETTTAPVTKEDIASIIQAEIKKALGDDEDDEDGGEAALTKEDIAEVVRKELSDVLKAKGIASNLNDESDPVKKNGQHYLHGIL
ncbi:MULTISPECIES: XkdF-like putative serine protease domain-containing protein [unclassified Dehalobacter]|uniref:XkdF-like putative serine protease domain-containing protein n=1 Tax=unclassified Dehalobacter TaxID=2635733 RepID=UPI001404A4B2|nr:MULTISPECIES: XkdF-like putative serine protease domain-containing protein [unclassified Dehalobacter]